MMFKTDHLAIRLSLLRDAGVLPTEANQLATISHVCVNVLFQNQRASQNLVGQ